MKYCAASVKKTRRDVRDNHQPQAASEQVLYGDTESNLDHISSPLEKEPTMEAWREDGLGNGESATDLYLNGDAAHVNGDMVHEEEEEGDGIAMTGVEEEPNYLREFPFEDLSPKHPADSMIDGRLG